jgi:predicted DNA-binding ribbon-helix-helix protein
MRPMASLLPPNVLPSEKVALEDLAKRRGISLEKLVRDLTTEAGEETPSASVLRVALLAELKERLPSTGLNENGEAAGDAVLTAALKAVREAK